MKVGELFVELGFKVDDSKLKTFDDSLNSVLRTGLQLAGIGGGLAGFYALAKGAEDNAVALRNLNSELGVNMQWAQGFAALWKTVNPTADINEGLKISAHMANYASQAKYTGASEYGLFGGDTSDFLDPATADQKMLARLKSGLPHVLAMFNGDKAKVSQLLQAITGSPDMMNVLNASDADYDHAKKLRDLTDAQILQTEKAGEAIAQLQTGWDNFVNHAIGTLAQGALSLKKDIDSEDHTWKGFFTGVGKWMSGGGIGDPLGITDIGKGLIDNPVMNAAVKAASGIGANKMDSMSFWEAKGYTPPQIAGWLAQEQAESDYGTNPNMNKNGHFGAFQWSADRAAKIKAATGIDVRTAPHWQQLQAASWEFNHMKMGIPAAQYKKIMGAGDASAFLSDNFEMHEKYNKAHGNEKTFRQRMAEGMADSVVNNVVINVQSNAHDNKEVAALVHQHFIDTTYPQIAKGAGY